MTPHNLKPGPLVPLTPCYATPKIRDINKHHYVYMLHEPCSLRRTTATDCIRYCWGILEREREPGMPSWREISSDTVPGSSTTTTVQVVVQVAREPSREGGIPGQKRASGSPMHWKYLVGVEGSWCQTLPPMITRRKRSRSEADCYPACTVPLGNIQCRRLARCHR